MSRSDHPEEALIQDILNDRDTPLVKKTLAHNQIIKHNFKKELIRKECCHLEGCEENFVFVLIPHQIIYPKFCDKHRSEYQRELFKNGS